MIIGLPKWNNSTTYYSQSNNALEQSLLKTGTKNWLESCGPTSAIMILEALDKNVFCETPSGWLPQPEDILTLWMNDPRNYETMKKIRNIDPNLFMGNRVPQWYEASIPGVFGVSAKFYWGLTKENIILSLKNNRGLLVTLKDPGHYVAIVAYDMEEDKVIYNDPWKENYWPEKLRGSSGFNRKILVENFLSNCKEYRIEIG